MSLLKLLDSISPLICRLYASAGPERLTVEEISKRSLLNKRTIIRLSRKKSWAGVPVETASRYLAGTGVGLDNFANPQDLILKIDVDGMTPKAKSHIARFVRGE